MGIWLWGLGCLGFMGFRLWSGLRVLHFKVLQVIGLLCGGNLAWMQELAFVL